MAFSNNLDLSPLQPVIPGSQIAQPIYTDGGFTSGDYVYRYGGNKVGQYPYLVVNLPTQPLKTIISGTNYSGSYGTAISFSRSSLTGPQSVPSTYSITTTASTYGGTYLATQNASSATANTLDPVSAVLTNGNIVVLCSVTTTLSYYIYSPTGTQVSTGTITSSYYNTSTYSNKPQCNICALNSGGFAVAWSGTSGQLNVAKYSATGSVVTSGAPSGYTGCLFLSICADKNDNLFVVYTTGTSGAANTLVAINSALTGVSYSISPGTTYYVPPQLCCTVGNNIVVSWNGTIGPNANIYTTNNNTSFSIIGTTSGIIAGQNVAGAICAAPNGGYWSVGVNSSGNVVVGYCTEAGSIYASASGSAPAYTGTYTQAAVVPYYGTTAGVYDGTSNSCVIYFTNSAGTGLSTVIATQTGTNSPTIGTATATSITITGTINRTLQSLTAGQGQTGSTPASYVVWYDNTSTYSKVAMINSMTFGSTTTLNTPSSYQPTYSNGYSLLGIAATTSSAGSMGKMIINGTAQLNSNYGTSSTPQLFNYNPTNGNGFLGNRGYVVNRVVTLQGLE